ncbi:hypothetical protein BU17DRAFT_70816 [Hysterangium stoloniferum]|nr:hypothetical protein BU17DRAFT_70816 [Hysterangium stoloniferum]
MHPTKHPKNGANPRLRIPMPPSLPLRTKHKPSHAFRDHNTNACTRLRLRIISEFISIQWGTGCYGDDHVTTAAGIYFGIWSWSGSGLGVEGKAVFIIIGDEGPSESRSVCLVLLKLSMGLQFIWITVDSFIIHAFRGHSRGFKGVVNKVNRESTVAWESKKKVVQKVEHLPASFKSLHSFALWVAADPSCVGDDLTAGTLFKTIDSGSETRMRELSKIGIGGVDDDGDDDDDDSGGSFAGKNLTPKVREVGLIRR